MRNPFDNLAKALLDALLSPAGIVKIEQETSTEPQSIDVWFRPSNQPGTCTVPGALALLARENAVIEPFHNPPSVAGVQACVLKQYSMFAELRRENEEGAELPTLWILSAGVPRKVIGAYGFKTMKGAPRGFLTPPRRVHRLRLVVIPNLERIRETLPLRLLGAGRTLDDALEDLRRLPETAPERVVLTPVLVRCRMEMAMQPGKRTQEDEELRQKVEWAYNEMLRKAEGRGEKRGEKRGEAAVVKRHFEHRLGRSLDPRERATLRKRLSTLGPERLGNVVLDLSAQDVATWLGDPNAR